jgi:hypothetical protein
MRYEKCLWQPLVVGHLLVRVMHVPAGLLKCSRLWESVWDLYSGGNQLMVSQDTDYSDRDVWFTSFPPNECRDYSLTTSLLHPFSSFFFIILSSKAIKFELLMAD